MRIHFLAGLLLVCSSVPSFAGEATEPMHPFLMTTRAAIERTRAALPDNKMLAAQAEELLEAAQAKSIDDLLPLETEWWTEAKDKPWSDTYPEINHHTGKAPREWAHLARKCAQADLLFPDAQMAEKAKQVLLGLSDYTFEFDHYDVGMNYATWGCVALDTYDILYDRFAPEERKRLDAFFRRMVEAIVKSDLYWIENEPGGPMNNHYLWHKLGRMMYGLFYGRPAMVGDAIEGPKGVLESMRHGFTDDGLWLEASLNYQFAATAAMLVMAEMLENAGSDFSIWNLTTDDGRTLKQSYDALVPTLFPDRTIPNIGDCYARRAHLGSHGDYETLFSRFGDPTHAWLISHYASKRGMRRPEALFQGVPDLPELVDTPAPPQVSRLWPEHGYAMLRTVEGTDYWWGKGWSLFATYSNAPVHQNADKLSIMLYGNSHHWLVDCEARAGVYHAFSSAVQRELNRQTICHNTLLVDGVGQRHPDRQLDLVEYAVLPDAKRLTMGDLDGRLYEGVRQLRTLIVRDEYVLDVFQVEAPEAHDYAWLTHIDGLSSGSSVPEWLPTDLPDAVPWKWIREPRKADGVGAYWETFTYDEERFRIDTVSDGPVEVVQCRFPRDDGPSPETYAMRMLRCRRPAARFVALYRLGDDADAPADIAMTVTNMGRFEVVLQLDGRDRRHLVPDLKSLR